MSSSGLGTVVWKGNIYRLGKGINSDIMVSGVQSQNKITISEMWRYVMFDVASKSFAKKQTQIYHILPHYSGWPEIKYA